jgi:SdpC family antimicrobial peptide
MHVRRGGAHRRPSRRVVAGVLAVAMMATAVSIALLGPSATAQTEPSAGAQKYDGKALLLGFFFGVGPVAEEYPKLVLTQIDETPEKLDAIADSIAKAEARSPGFLAAFGSAMYSGDIDVIAEAATEAVARLVRVSVKIEGTGAGVFDPVKELLALVQGKPHAVNPALVGWAGVVARTLSVA